MDMVYDQLHPVQTAPARTLQKDLPEPVMQLIRQCEELNATSAPEVFNTLLPLGAESNPRQDKMDFAINLPCVNDIRFINKFFESVNEHLEHGGFFIGCVQTSGQRKNQMMAQFPRPLNTIVYSFDFLIKRVWPKLPYLRRSYFALTKGRNRVISEMETYGRLYSCGFQLLDTVETNGKLYFAVQKTGEPDYNTEATYGPFIKLRRVGKNGKIVKVLKLRTMYPYSEYVQQFIYERNGLAGIGKGAKFVDDPRITTLGRFCRKYWIDELPMLFNLLRGDVKLFGVRPLSKHYFSLYPPEFQEFRKKFKPGLIPPVYVEIPKSLDDTVEIEWRYLKAYERSPILTDIRYTTKALYNIFIKKVRSC